MTGNYSEEMGAVKSDLQTLKEDLATLTKSVKADAQANALELRANAKTKFDAARANAMEAGTKGRAKAQTTIKDNPIVSIAATAGLGLILGAPDGAPLGRQQQCEISEQNGRGNRNFLARFLSPEGRQA
jgi:ElaB/YqjD/DUF883 family membrane-anchored ribosome-binding protein